MARIGGSASAEIDAPVDEVWESEEDANRFFKEQLEPAFEAVGVPGRTQPEFWPVHNYMT